MKPFTTQLRDSDSIALLHSSAQIIPITRSSELVRSTPAASAPRSKRVKPKETRSRLMPCVFLREYPQRSSWILDLVSIDGKPTHKTLGRLPEMSELDACIRAKDILKAIREGRNPFMGDMTVEDYFDKVRTPWAQAHKRSVGTEVAVFDRYIRRQVRQLRMGNVCLHHLQALIDIYSSGQAPTVRKDRLAPGTVYQIIALLKALFKWAYRRGDIVADPAFGIRQVKLDNARHVRFSAPELAAIGVALKSARPLTRLLFVMLLSTGTRIGELLNARHEDVDEAACTLLLPMTKSGRSFVVPCSPEFMRAYGELKTLRKHGNPYLFPSARGSGPMTAPRRDFKKVLEAAGIAERRTFHDARRTAASVAITVPGVTLLDVSRSLNHSSVAITEQRYLVSGDDRIRNALTQSSKRLGEMLRSQQRSPAMRAALRPSVRSVRVTSRVEFVIAGYTAMNG